MRVLALTDHTTHDAHGTPVVHAAGSTYDVDETLVETLEAIGFAKRDDSGTHAAPVPDEPPPVKVAARKR